MPNKVTENASFKPLAARIRPKNIHEFVGQSHLLAPKKPLWEALQSGTLHSMIFWGPPGTGKTTLARLLATASHAAFFNLSAVMVGIKEIRETIQKAKTLRKDQDQGTVLFLDEVHRFNKSQQDAFLPYVEDGTLIFIGATTENPSFEINNALLSRARVYVLNPLTETEIIQIIENAIHHEDFGFSFKTLNFPEELKLKLARLSDGDARQALNLLEVIFQHITAKQKYGELTITEDIIDAAISGTLRRFDKGGEYFYDQISALHKSVRGSSPDGAIYWFARMIDGGCDPLYIARRVVRMAIEDIGLADPKALDIALNAWDTYERLGSPEGELGIAEAIIYLAVAPKSNRVYLAYLDALKDAKEYGSLPVPLVIRNAPTKLMKQLGYGKDYRYDHSEENAIAIGQQYLPDKLLNKVYYQPTTRGLELKIKEKLESLHKLQENHKE